MDTFDRFAQLWGDYLEGDLCDQGMEELHQLVQSQPQCREIAKQHYQLHRALGLVFHDDAEAFIAATLGRVPDNSDDFVARVVAQASQRTARRFSLRPLAESRTGRRKVMAVAALAAAVMCLWVWWSNRDRGSVSPTVAIVAPKSSVKFSHTARAKFLGAFAPAIGSDASFESEYILISGSVQMLFPKGAEVIIQGPAVFQIASAERLYLSVGRCSVHCPAGAEGFAVDTPNALVVDRGTRFFVNVAEASATEVHVVEGIAEIYGQPGFESGGPVDNEAQSYHVVRLSRHEARTIESDRNFAPQPTDFQSSLFQSGLPDRIVSYQATQVNGGARDLTSVDVQRDGKLIRYSADSLIRSKLVWFQIDAKIADMRHLAGDAQLPVDRHDLLLDLGLNTGPINPGGSLEPWDGDPLFPGSGEVGQAAPGQPTTPGLAVQFSQPVINHPGPDVVFFELQSVTGAPEGDPFHVLPLKKLDRRKAITIDSYDLTLTSPEAQRPANFFLHESEQAVNSLDQLVHGDCHVLPKPQGSAGYRVIATTIDLSAMGFDEGEAVEGLFFQDALDDMNHVDPVAILGLPASISVTERNR